MSDIKLFRIEANRVDELPGQSMALERQLQTLMEKHLDTLLGLRFLATEYSTGPKHKGRIDTLAIDEDGCPVIIEYKRTSNENVINQGLFYLDWLMDHQAEFKLLVLETLGKDAADAIEWSGPRLLCIAGDFTRYDEHAVLQMNRNIELIRYRHYPDGFLILEKVNSSSSDTAAATANTAAGTNNKHSYKTISQYLESAPEDVIELYQGVEDLLLSLGDDIDKKTLKYYVAFKRLKNVACVEIRNQTRCVIAFLKCPPTPENLIEGFTRDVRNIGHFGTGDLEVTIRSKDDIERARHLFEMSYQLS